MTHLLAAAGFTDAVFFDGSNSAMMRYKGRMMAPDNYKADITTAAAGFAGLPPSAPSVPGPHSL